MLFVGSHTHYNPPYPYPFSYPAYIYVHVPFITSFNPEGVLWNIGIQPPHYMVQQPEK